jgi:hypothetical protein
MWNLGKGHEPLKVWYGSGRSVDTTQHGCMRERLCDSGLVLVHVQVLGAASCLAHTDTSERRFVFAMTTARHAAGITIGRWSLDGGAGRGAGDPGARRGKGDCQIALGARYQLTQCLAVDFGPARFHR